MSSVRRVTAPCSLLGIWYLEVLYKCWLSKYVKEKFYIGHLLKNGKTDFIQYFCSSGERLQCKLSHGDKRQEAYEILGCANRKALKVFKGSWSRWLGHLGLFIGPYLEEKQTSPIFRTRSSFATWSKVPAEVRLLSSHRNWETGALSPWVFAFQRGSSQLTGDMFLGGRRVTSQRGRKSS